MTLRKYTYNVEFFKHESLSMAYCLGFIAADGCVIPDKRYNTTRLQVGALDCDVIEYIKTVSNFTGPIQVHKRLKDPFYYIEICGIQNDWAIDLAKHSIIPRKSLILEKPALTDDVCKLAYILGYIDGDGCVSLRGKQLFPYISILGTKALLSWILTELKARGYAGNTTIRQLRNQYALEIGHKPAHAIIQQIANLPVFKLDRKWNKVLGA